jgi:hypothetical protein
MVYSSRTFHEHQLCGKSVRNSSVTGLYSSYDLWRGSADSELDVKAKKICGFQLLANFILFKIHDSYRCYYYCFSGNTPYEFLFRKTEPLAIARRDH